MRKEHSPLDSMRVMEGHSTCHECLQHRSWRCEGGVCACVCARYVCPYFKLIHPLAVIQGAELAC